MEQLINFIIRPPRADYEPNTDLLDQEFALKGKWFQRKDLEIKNSRGDVLQCSHYVPIVGVEGKCLPCVIYCHGNSGCRADASEAAIILLPSNITVFALDFSGSGLSGGEHVTLGWNEKDDLRVVVEYLRRDGNVSLIGLWGRSMGAVTSLLYGAEDPSIAGMVLDSPFSNLVELMMELVDAYKFPLPKFTVRLAIQYMRKAVQRKANFDIMDLNAIQVAKSCFVPVLIGHATADDFIRPHHSELIHDAYMGDKNIIKFKGDHNSLRPQFYFDSITIFFHNVLHPPEDDISEGSMDSGYEDFCSPIYWEPEMALGRGLFSDEPGVRSPSKGPPTSRSCTEDAIKRLHSKRPMSRTEVPSCRPSDTKAPHEKEKMRENCTLASSSSMVNFEVSNTDMCGAHIPALLEDSLDGGAHVPALLKDPLDGGAHVPPLLEDPLDGGAHVPPLFEDPLAGGAHVPILSEDPLAGGAHVPTLLQDPLAGGAHAFPSSQEEEEKMLKEAILESLKTANLMEEAECEHVVERVAAVDNELEPASVNTGEECSSRSVRTGSFDGPVCGSELVRVEIGDPEPAPPPLPVPGLCTKLL